MLDVFKPVTVVRDVRRVESLPDEVRDFAREPITLGWEDRMRVRGLRRSDSGIEFAVALPRATVLRDGDCFVLDKRSLILVVVEQLEAVFVVEPRTRREWGLFGYQIGNSHQPLMITDAAIVCPDLPGMEQLLQYHAIPFVRTARAFTPVSRAEIDGDARHGRT